MIKHVMLIILLSAGGIFFKNELVHVLDGLVIIHNAIAQMLHLVFSDGRMGRLIQDMISLLIIPFFAGIFVVSIFWLIKRGGMPHAMSVVWVLWLVLFVTMLAQSHMSRSPADQGPLKVAATQP